MVRKQRGKPGPKSAKPSQIIQTIGDLGESSSTGKSDSSTVNQTDAVLHTQESSVSRPQLGTDNQSDAEYSQIRQLSPRRCSTMRYQSDQSGSRRADATAAQVQQKELPKKNTKKKAAKETEATTSAAAATNEPSTVARRPRKQRNPQQLGRRFWKEVTKLQNQIDSITPKLPFSRLVREIMLDASTEVRRITPAALSALQLSSELYLTQRLQDAYMLTLFRGRVTLEVRDMKMVQYLKQNLQ